MLTVRKGRTPAADAAVVAGGHRRAAERERAPEPLIALAGWRVYVCPVAMREQAGLAQRSTHDLYHISLDIKLIISSRMSSQNIKKSRKRRRSSESAAVPAGSGPEDMDQLPIAQYRSKLVEAILSQPVTVVVGETGSGKSTQLPQFLSEALHKKSGDGADGRRPGCIVCTQPRRVAAVTIAKRVAAERRCKIGQEVGYSIRFDDCSSVSTRIKFVTDGVLLREALTDSNLSRYSVVILDEAHERSLQTDILMGILKMLLAKRTDLR